MDWTTNSRGNRALQSRHSIKARKGEQVYSCLENEIEYLSNRLTKMGSEKGTKQNQLVCTVLTFKMRLFASYWKTFSVFCTLLNLSDSVKIFSLALGLAIIEPMRKELTRTEGSIDVDQPEISSTHLKISVVAYKMSRQRCSRQVPRLTSEVRRGTNAPKRWG